MCAFMRFQNIKFIQVYIPEETLSLYFSHVFASLLIDKKTVVFFILFFSYRKSS